MVQLVMLLSIKKKEMELMKNNTLSLDEIKKIEFEILQWFDGVCKQYHLQYFLFSGTLLGAVRHKGFIPWDDDIDVVMLRADYERLLKISICDSRYKLISIKSDNTFFYPFAKAIDTYTSIEEHSGDGITRSVWIDIFPLDNDLPTPKERKRRAKEIHLRRRLLHYSTNKHHSGNRISVIAKDIVYKMLKVYGSYNLTMDVIKAATKYNDLDTEYLSDLSWGKYSERQVWKRKWFYPIELEFEKHYFPVPGGYHEILSTLYGNYMKLPSEQYRTPAHNLVVYYQN